MEIHEFDPVIYPYRLWIIIDKSPYDNDSLDLLDFLEWFRGKISIDMEPMAIIQFTPFRY